MMQLFHNGCNDGGYTSPNSATGTFFFKKLPQETAGLQGFNSSSCTHSVFSPSHSGRVLL